MNWKSFGKSFLDLLIIGFFTTIAGIATIAISAVKTDSVDWISLYNGGDFFLYSISLFSSSLIFYINRKDREFGKYMVIILILLCTIIFTQFVNEQKSNTAFTKISSYTFLSLSCISFWITQYYQRLEMPDVNQQDLENQQQMAKGIKFNN